MKFGIFYELQLPRPWQPGDEHRLYQNALEQIELADRLGYDHAWQVEHHFLEEYSHSPSPESFLAAASQRTKNIRLGHGIYQLTTNHPARIAERTASLDLLSNGRVEFGMGESASITELEPFGVDMDNKREIFEEAVRAIIPMFKDGPSEHHGKYFDMPLRIVMPKPLQKPHPPLWVACSQLETLAKCRRMGHGRARLPVRLGRCRACLGARLLQRLREAAEEARRLQDQPQHRAGLLLHVRQDRRGGARARRRRHLLPVRAAFLRPVGARPASPAGRHRQHVGRVQQVEEGQSRRARRGAARRPDRLAGDDPQEAAPGSSRPTSTRSCCSTRPARTRTSTSANRSSCSPRK